jgi:hypothetical protein
VTKKRNERDLAMLLGIVRDFTHTQSELFILVVTTISRHAAPELTPLVDEDVGEAAATLAATFETASRGVIYEHQTTSLNAGRLATALKAVFQQAGKSGGTPFERDAALVLRQVEAGVRSTRAAEPDNPRAFLGLIERTMRKTDPAADTSPEPSSRLIVP